MKKTNKASFVLGGLILFFALMCAVGSTDAEAAMKLNAKSKTIYVGRTYTLKVLNTKKSVKWKSSKKSVATVSKKGVVKGVKAGKAVISAQIGKKQLKCNVTVKNNVSVSKSSVTLDKDKSTTVKITIKKDVNNIRFKVGNPGIASCKWGNWKGMTIPLKITANKPGTTTVTITNSYSKEKVKIKVKVRQPWDNVKVVIPNTIGEQDSPGNRMKITKYSFYQEYSGSSFYTMDIQFKLVQYNKTGRSNWGEHFYCYDKYGNILKKCYLYASSLALNYTYTDDALIPVNTAKIVFMEYPDPNSSSNSGSNSGSNNNSGNNGGNTPAEPTKWTVTELKQLQTHVNNAAKDAQNAADYADKAYKNAGAAAVYGSMSKQCMEYALADLQKAYDLTQKKVPLNLVTNGEPAGTLGQRIEEAIAAYDGWDQLENSNASEIRSMANNGNVKVIGLKALMAKLMLEVQQL